MRRNNAKVVSRPVQKSATFKPRTAMKKVVATNQQKNLVKGCTSGCITPPDQCNPVAIATCDCVTEFNLPCLDPSNLIPNGDGTYIVNIDGALNSALYYPEDIANCATTTCTEDCASTPPFPSLQPSICSIQQLGTDLITNNNGAWKAVRTFLITDACGNQTTISRTVTFTLSNPDGAPLTISPTVDEVLAAVSGSQTCSVDNNPTPDCECIDLGCNTGTDIDWALGIASSTDPCATITPSDSTITVIGCFNYQTRTFTAVDACGNQSTLCRTIRWGDDVEPPVITFDGDACQYIQLDTCNPTSDEIEAAFDACPPSVGNDCATLTHGEDTLSGDCCTRTVTRTWTATDECGNTSSAEQTVTYPYDNDPPITAYCPADKSIPCGEDPTQYFDLPVYYDICTPQDEIGLSYYDEQSSNNPDGSYTVTRYYTATDLCGNANSDCSQTITVLGGCNGQTVVTNQQKFKPKVAPVAAKKAVQQTKPIAKMPTRRTFVPNNQ